MGMKETQIKCSLICYSCNVVSCSYLWFKGHTCQHTISKQYYAKSFLILPLCLLIHSHTQIYIYIYIYTYIHVCILYIYTHALTLFLFLLLLLLLQISPPPNSLPVAQAVSGCRVCIYTQLPPSARAHQHHQYVYDCICIIYQEIKTRRPL